MIFWYYFPLEESVRPNFHCRNLAAPELPDVLLEEIVVPFYQKAANIWGSDCWKDWEMACDRVSTEMRTEEGNDNAEAKDDNNMETDVVAGADSPLVDEVGLCGSNKAEILLRVLWGMFEDKP